MEAVVRRLRLIEKHLTNTELQADGDLLEVTGLARMFPEPINLKRTALRQVLDAHQELIMNSYETATFPAELRLLIKKLGIFGYDPALDLVYRPSLIEKAAICYELSRSDSSICTFWIVQQELVISSIEILASPLQQEKYLVPLRKMDLIGSWCLTEPDAGSDASNMELAATPVEGGYLLNGFKKWIGNASFSDIMVVFSRDTASKKVIGMIVDSSSAGLSVTDIRHKICMRTLKNGLIQFKDVFVPIANLLAKAQDFETGPNAILAMSRLGIIWSAIGSMAGVYEHSIKLLMKSPKFVRLTAIERPIGARSESTRRDLAVVREKLGRILGMFKGCFLMVLHQTNLLTQGKVSIGQVSLVKGEVSRICREVCRIGQELQTEQGLFLDNVIIKYLSDTEALYTGEGAYDVSVLVAGRELTGISSIKSTTVLQD